MDLKEKIAALPTSSGVYLMKNAQGRVIYVGKAVSLRQRVRSYFRRGGVRDGKTDLLVQEVADIDTILAASEAEALLLEASLIKRYRPKYNIELRDDKSYPVIEITGDPFPRVSVGRPRRRDPASTYYGPYVNAGLVREALSIIRRIFPFRVCDPLPQRVCLDYHMRLCDGPCEGRVGTREYARNIRHIRLMLDGKKDALCRTLRRQMEQASQKREYERAAKIRDQLRAIGALYSGTRDVNYYKEAEQLQRALGLPVKPQRIETFDISNIMGNHAVGSMVSFLNGRPDKANYRRFKIKTVEGIDDFQMIAEVVRRRYSRLKRERRLFPDLIVIDGGKGQLSSACAELKKLDVTIPIIALAKRAEEIFLPGRRQAVRLPPDSLGLKLLQRARDEAHRFAVAYHRKLRTNQFLKSEAAA